MSIRKLDTHKIKWLPNSKKMSLKPKVLNRLITKHSKNLKEQGILFQVQKSTPMHFITTTTSLAYIPFKPKERTRFSFKDTPSKKMQFYFRGDLNKSFKYTGNSIPNCDCLYLDCVYEDEKVTLLVFTLLDNKQIFLQDIVSTYVLCLDKRNFRNGHEVDLGVDRFKDFPELYNLIKQYGAKDIRLYESDISNKHNKSVLKQPGEEGLDALLMNNLWMYLMASIHKEYEKHEDKEPLYYNRYIRHQGATNGQFNYIPSDLLTFDQYASIYYNVVVINHLKYNYSSLNSIIAHLPIIANMIEHNSYNVEEYLGVVGGAVCNIIMKELRSKIESSSTYNSIRSKDYLPENIYKKYKSTQNKLTNNHDYFRAITKQLYKYVYKESTNEERDRIVCVLEKENNRYTQTIKWYVEDSGNPHVASPGLTNVINGNSIYLGCYDNADGVNLKLLSKMKNSFYVKKPIPVKSFKIEEYKEIIRAEYDLIPEIKDYMHSSISNCNKTNDCGVCIFGGAKTYNQKYDCTKLWTMVIFNDFEVGFRLGCDKIESGKETKVYHHYLSVTGEEFISELPSKLTPELVRKGVIPKILCYVTEKQFKDIDFRKSYPKLCAMYERGLKLYHEFSVYGEKNTMAEIISKL